jgi:putative FmdB family regulatory protein
MPLYEYECDSCGKRFERIQKFSDPPIAECPTCGGPVHKLFSSPAIQFKGSGWYITDYARSGASDKGGSSSPSTDAPSAPKTTDAGGDSPKPASDAPKSTESAKSEPAPKPASPSESKPS